MGMRVDCVFLTEQTLHSLLRVYDSLSEGLLKEQYIYINLYIYMEMKAKN